MKILIELFSIPFFLAHGGAQTQVQETVNALRNLGVDVEFTRWWDGTQKADLIHSFGVPGLGYLKFAKAKNIRTVNTTLFSATCNRPAWKLGLQGKIVSALLKIPPIQPWGGIRSQLVWESFKNCDLNIVGLNAEAVVLKKIYGVPDDKIATIPLGLAKPFLDAGAGSREQDNLITTGTITEQKRSVELARMAHSIKVPICFVGKPYDSNGAYWREFQSLVDGSTVTHIPHTESVDQMIDLLKAARGYVHYSTFENWCLSAHEAIACGLPLLVPDQPWSRERFGDQATYFPGANPASHAMALRKFHELCGSLPSPKVRLYSWRDVAKELIHHYQRILS